MGQVRVRGLGHGFVPGTELFHGLDLDLGAGDLVAVTGPSGCGKSTLLHLLAGWERPRSGSIEVTDVGRVGWVFQNPHGVGGRTARDHVALPLLARGALRSDADRDADALLRRFGLGPIADRPFRNVSGGEAQRLMLARAAASAPGLLLVDEPTAQLDPCTARTVNDVLAEIAAADVIVVVATHDPGTSAACHRVVDLTDLDASVAGEPAC